MSKVTSKLQVTLPKAIANRFHIKPGDEIDWQDSGDTLRVLLRRLQPARLPTEKKLDLFDKATERQLRRETRSQRKKATPGRRWAREELYRRGRAD